MLHFPDCKSGDESVRVGAQTQPLKTPKVVVICGWCPDVWIRTKGAQAAGVQISHGICDSCADRMAKAGRADGAGWAGGTGGDA